MNLQEARFYVEAFEGLEKVEKLKDFDDYDAQTEYWEAKISEEINLRILTRQPLSVDLLKTALCMHESSSIKKEMLNLLEHYKKEIEVTCQKEENDREQINYK